MEIIQNLPQEVLWGEHQEKGICAWARMPPNLSHLYVRAANEEPLVQDTTPAKGGNVTFVAGSSDENWQNEKVNKVDVTAHHLTEYMNSITAHKFSLPVQCTIFIIHCYYKFRPEDIAIFRQLQISRAYTACMYYFSCRMLARSQ